MRKPHAADSQLGASLLESAVAISVVGVLAATLLQRLLYVEEYAEKTAMELTIANMRAGMRGRVGLLLIADQASKIPTLAGENPVQWLEREPENYLGELEQAPRPQPKGKWYFDLKRRELVYTANSRAHFTPSRYQDYSVRLRVMPVPALQTMSGAHTPRQQDWVALAVVNDYRWF